MIRQETKYNKESFNQEEYKEYHDGVLVTHTKYDKNNNKIFYANGDGFHYNRRFAKGCKDNCGEIVFYKDSNGILKDRRTHDNFVDISIKIEPITINNQQYMVLLVEWQNASGCRYTLKAYKEKGDSVFHAKFFEERTTQYTLSYNSNIFEEMYYQHITDTKRRIIHHDVAYDMTNFKWLLEEFNVVLHSKRYRVELRNFRDFVPIY